MIGTQLGYFNNLISNKLVKRVKFVAAQTSYDSAVTVAADTDLNPDLAGKSVTQLKDFCTANENFRFAEERSIYSYVGGTTTSTITIPLGKVNKTCIVGGFAVITDSCGGTQSFSVGIPGNTDFILGSTIGTDLAVPAGCETAIWNQGYPYATATPDAGGVSAGRIYYAPDRMLAPGTPINLYITAGTSCTIGEGDITFEFLATAIGQETYGITDGNNNKRSASGAPGPLHGKDSGPIYPYFG
jgi:hypothetical protein